MANLSSLTEQELLVYKKALEQAKFYKYYEALVKGEDKLTKISFQKMGEAGDKWVYQVTLHLKVADQEFHRDFIQEVEKEEKTGFWANLGDTALKVGIGILIGVAAGFGAASR
jgi:hypothetical protein